MHLLCVGGYRRADEARRFKPILFTDHKGIGGYRWPGGAALAQVTEADGDFEKAIEILRKKGQKVSASRSDKDAKEGSVFVKTSDDKKEAVLIALNCETDFVAKNEEF